MRRAPGVLLIAIFVFAFSANLRSGTNDVELTPRSGVPARVMLKGCHKLESIAVDFDGNGDPYYGSRYYYRRPYYRRPALSIGRHIVPSPARQLATLPWRA